jgi:mono/diheme cytochrome c family protein
MKREPFHVRRAAARNCSNSLARSSLTRRRRASTMMTAPQTCIRRLFAGGLFVFCMMSSSTTPSVSAQAYPPDRARGKAVYERHCQICHGPTGRGDGPGAASSKIPPANFQKFQSFLKSDEELLRTIEHGVVFSPMHAWRGQLTDGEMQDVVAYIRVLSEQAR